MYAKFCVKPSTTPQSSRRNSLFSQDCGASKKNEKNGGKARISWGLVVAGCGGMGLGVRQLEAKARSPPRAQ